MTALKAQDVERFVSRPDIEAGLFLIYGPDAGLVHETASRLARRFAGAAGDSEIISLDQTDIDTDPGRLAVESGMHSLFGGKRVLRVRGAGKSLVSTLGELVAGLAVPIILEAGNLSPRDPLRTLVEAAASGRTLPCYADGEQSLSRLVAESFSRAGIALDADVVPTLCDILGNDREVTRRELEKLALYAGPGGRLRRDDVLALCADNAALLLDEIIDAVATGHADRAEQALDRAFAASISPQQLLAMTLGHFVTLRRWRGEIDAGASVRTVLDGARPRPHFSRRAAIEQQLRVWRDSSLGAAAERLHLAAGESRKRHQLEVSIVRRAFLAVTMIAAER